MDGRQHAASVRQWKNATANFIDTQRPAGNAPHSGCTERNDNIRPDEPALEVEPPVAAIDFVSIRAFVQTPFATLLKLEVLYGVGHKNRFTLDTCFFQGLREHATGGPDKRLTLL